MADNQTTGTLILTPSVIGGVSTGLTLDAFRRIMHYSPLAFMGVTLQGNCPPYDCDKRDLFVQAARTAIDMIEGQLVRHNLSMFSGAITLSSGAPYFKLDGYSPYTTTTHRYTGIVAVDPLTGIATITVAVIPLSTGEEFVSATIIFPDCVCLRLDVELCGEPTLVGGILTLQARGYNFIDLDNGPYPGDAIQYVDTVTVEVVTRTPAVPKAKWTQVIVCSTDTPDPYCVYVESTGCLIERRYGIFDVRNYTTGLDCATTLCLHHFELQATRVGVWRSSWADAIVSLINTLLPVDYCDCEPLANVRYRADNAQDSTGEKVYAYSWNNPFGILKPGAKRAWNAIEPVFNGTEVYKS